MRSLNQRLGFIVLIFSSALSASVLAQPDPQSATQTRWYKGNLHTHSLWSDGDDFPEMIVKWYAERDYNFLALTDHNILSRGQRWMDLATIESRGGNTVMPKYRAAFDENWIETRQQQIKQPDQQPDQPQAKQQVRLKTLQEFRGRFEKPGRFLLIEGEEISDSVDGLPVHLNASNLESLLQPVGGDSVREAIDNNLRAAAEQARKTGRQILVHLNHPNYGYAVTAEDIAAVTRERFFEIFNGHPSVNQLGDKVHPSMDRMWDIVNTIRIDKLNAEPVYGLGTDDCHNYHGRPGSQPGRAWINVRAAELTTEALLKAMYRGDFYASSGVQLADVLFDKNSRTLEIKIIGAKGAEYETRFIGTKKGYDDSAEPLTDDEGNPIRTTRQYSADVGIVLDTQSGNNPKYQLKGDEIYVRAVITSSRQHPNPSLADQFEQAWTQPIGWRK